MAVKDPRPSVQLVRAAIVAAFAGGLAVVLHEVALIVVASPFILWCALGWWRLRTAKGTTAERISTRRLAVGQVAEYEVSTPEDDTIVALHLPRPPRCDVEPAMGASVGVGSTAVRVRPMRWGRQVLEPLETSVTDAWGMWVSFWTPRTEFVTVAPGLGTPGGGDAIPHPIGLVGIHQSRSRGDGSDLAEIRGFVAGDRLKRINWRVTSRTGSLHTNATTAERDTEVLVVVDTLADMAVDQGGRNDTGGESSSSLDIAVSAAATIADHYLGLGDRVGLHDLGRVIGPIPTGSGARHRGVIIERLAKGWAERASAGQVKSVGRVRAGSLVLVCTPLLHADVVDEVLRLLHRGAAVLVVDTLPPGLGDVETVTTPTGWRERFEDRVRRHRYWDEAWALRRLERDRMIDGMNRLGVPVVAWQGIGSLGQVIAALAANRSAPRMARR
ncbi:MAG TPA: DUF58 domain-containing protein [Candidatus Avipropionibacterium avicola]|uniref:DUF58 domain-containing protein n=1 Tax=Candidatus Avipropionibacterium avicola TaxID=2840701 RepID=A0A9D1KLR7_9ACTN|nr:DUF58 domain-containing protein [Candidatus Avipropionibacterium avicola]